MGLPDAYVETMLREAMARRSALRLVATGWLGAEVPRDELVNDQPASKTLVLDVGETLHGRSLGPVFGPLHLRLNSLAFIEEGQFSDCMFFRDSTRRVAVVAPFPGVTVPVASLMIDKAEAEAIRVVLAAKLTPASKATSSMSPTNDVSNGALVSTITDAIRRTVMGPAHKHLGTRTSAMLEVFYSKKTKWAPSTREQNMRMCAVFVELMDDPVVGAIDRDMIFEFTRKLLRLPQDLRNVRTKHPGLSLKKLSELAEKEGWPTQNEARAARYIAKIGEAFVWATKNDYMLKNPAANAAPEQVSAVRGQDKRELFGEDVLGQIFSADWFSRGGGEKTTRGVYHYFQPFYYWIPLLGLYTGARINELSQLYLKDLVQTKNGTWYIDFNLEGEGKIDADGGQPQSKADNRANDKRLKTVAARRIIPLHPALTTLGLPEYAKSLSALGEQRLFPELKHDRLKGYGKYAGQWFNERYLGRQLKITRDSTQTFHSFRHTFLTACDRLEMTDRIRNEIAGHVRGEGQGPTVYIKDRNADLLAPHVAQLVFALPHIAPFDCAEGIKALVDAKSRKAKAVAQKRRHQ